MIATTHDIKGKLIIQKFDTDGNLVDEKTTFNSITTAGRRLVADLFKFNMLDSQDDKIKRISWIHLGRSNAPFKPEHTELQDHVGRTKINSVEYVPTGNDRVSMRLVGELGTQDCNAELKEAGLFTDDAKPVMYNRVIFDTITKSDKFKLTLIWELTF
jgi:hypothetical protein